MTDGGVGAGSGRSRVEGKGVGAAGRAAAMPLQPLLEALEKKKPVSTAPAPSADPAGSQQSASAGPPSLGLPRQPWLLRAGPEGLQSSTGPWRSTQHRGSLWGHQAQPSAPAPAPASSTGSTGVCVVCVWGESQETPGTRGGAVKNPYPFVELVPAFECTHVFGFEHLVADLTLVCSWCLWKQMKNKD